MGSGTSSSRSAKTCTPTRRRRSPSIAPCVRRRSCSTAVGSFLAAAQVQKRVGGRVSLFGTPAEEGGGGKETMARAGAFDDVDAVIMLHPFSHDVAIHPFLG